MRINYFIVALVTVFTLPGCAITPVANSVRFQKAERPPSGFARLYVFRPGFSQVSSRDAPTLLIGDSEVFALAYESYTSVVLHPGKYGLFLKPNFMDSAVWNASTELLVEANKIYYLAIWNDIEYANGINVVPVMGKTPFLLALPTNGVRNTNVRFEVVPEGEATPVLERLSFISPLVGTFDARH